MINYLSRRCNLDRYNDYVPQNPERSLLVETIMKLDSYNRLIKT